MRGSWSESSDDGIEVVGGFDGRSDSADDIASEILPPSLPSDALEATKSLDEEASRDLLMNCRRDVLLTDLD